MSRLDKTLRSIKDILDELDISLRTPSGTVTKQNQRQQKEDRRRAQFSFYQELDGLLRDFDGQALDVLREYDSGEGYLFQDALQPLVLEGAQALTTGISRLFESQNLWYMDAETKRKLDGWLQQAKEELTLYQPGAYEDNDDDVTDTVAIIRRMHILFQEVHKKIIESNP